jgi:caa(3)-type oxidase subunit IV
MFIASLKAGTVFLWFMHLKYDGNDNRSIIASTLGFLALFIGFSALDLFTR